MRLFFIYWSHPHRYTQCDAIYLCIEMRRIRKKRREINAAGKRKVESIYTSINESDEVSIATREGDNDTTRKSDAPLSHVSFYIA